VTITSVLRKPEVLRTLSASVLARIPFGAMELLTVLRVTDSGYSWAQAGIAAAGYSLAVAVGQPVLSRVIDRAGQTRVLMVTALTGALMTLTLAFLPSSSPLWLFIAVATLTGAMQPPLGGTMRALWDLMLTRDAERHVGFAVEASAVELVFTGGPLVIVGVIAAVFGPQSALVVCALLTGVGTLAFATAGPSRRWRPDRTRKKDLFGALRSPGVWTLMAASIGMGAGFGSIELAVTAFGRSHDNTSLIGILLAIWSISSLVGGLVIARFKPAKVPAHRLVLLLFAIAVGNSLLGLGTTPVVLGLLLLISGAWIAPMFATANALMGLVAPKGMITEAYSWTLAAVMVGFTVGSPLSGYLIDNVSIHAAFAASGVPLLIAGIVIWLRRATLIPICEDVAPRVARIPFES
jgi:predicted MFS family arabinose efflux permease